ncbi:MAG TPA: hypothetical protein VHA09_05380 [Nitrososphaera sp.]|nr:hypothetical protein [Nitrososphaera sp.]
MNDTLKIVHSLFQKGHSLIKFYYVEFLVRKHLDHARNNIIKSFLNILGECHDSSLADILPRLKAKGFLRSPSSSLSSSSLSLSSSSSAVPL